MGEKELEIKLDITKKSRKINRPVQFHDQTGQKIENKTTFFSRQIRYDFSFSKNR